MSVCHVYKFKVDDQTITDPYGIASKFKEYFVNVGPNLVANITNNQNRYKSYLRKRNVNSICLDPVTEDLVSQEIEQLNANKSSGYDDISPKIVKCCEFYCETYYIHIQSVYYYRRKT